MQRKDWRRLGRGLFLLTLVQCPQGSHCNQAEMLKSPKPSTGYRTVTLVLYVSYRTEKCVCAVSLRAKGERADSTLQYTDAPGSGAAGGLSALLNKMLPERYLQYLLIGPVWPKHPALHQSRQRVVCSWFLPLHCRS